MWKTSVKICNRSNVARQPHIKIRGLTGYLLTPTPCWVIAIDFTALEKDSRFQNNGVITYVFTRFTIVPTRDRTHLKLLRFWLRSGLCIWVYHKG